MGTLIGTRVIPLEELGRPRIDVVIIDPHNIRSICPNTFKILDNKTSSIAQRIYRYRLCEKTLFDDAPRN